MIDAYDVLGVALDCKDCCSFLVVACQSPTVPACLHLIWLWGQEDDIKQAFRKMSLQSLGTSNALTCCV